jgi:hypothetical protein
MYKEAAEKLKPLLTDEFLTTLTEAAKIYGWDGDYTEIASFVGNLHEAAGKEKPNLEPYE